MTPAHPQAGGGVLFERLDREYSLPAGADLDGALPGLHTLMLAAVHDTGFPGIIGRIERIEVLKHHRGRRCTVRVHTVDQDVVVKSYAGGVTRLTRLLAHLSSADLTGFRAPTLLGSDETLRFVVTDMMPSTTVEDLVRSGSNDAASRGGRLAAQWVNACELLQPGRSGLELPRVDVQSSVTRLARRAEAWPDARVSTCLTALIGSIRLGVLPASKEGGALVHGSMKLDHLHDCGGDVGLVDWDGHRVGPAEFDAATFVATALRIAAGEAALVPGVSAALSAFRSSLAADEAVLRGWLVVALAKAAAKLALHPAPSAPAALSLIGAAEMLMDGADVHTVVAVALGSERSTTNGR